MKTSLKKLQKFAALRHDKRAAKQHQSLNQDELARATQDMSDMRDCYDTLLSAAAATANSAYEFSESLKEMGGCLLEKTSLNDDEESGKVLLMLGKTQFELQKLVDVYRSHIFQTITIPSESLLNELHIVEEMKKRCDEKREIYEALTKKPKEKGRSKGNKGDHVPSHQLKAAHDDYDEEANVFVFRMKSLKQGQSRSLLTQAARHHAAQLCFFKKAVRYLEAIDPNIRFVAEQQHIDFQFIGLKDEGLETYEDDDDNDDENYSSGDYDSSDISETLDDEGLKIDDAQDPSTAKHSMELDDADITVSPNPKSGAAKELLRIPGRSSFSFRRGSVSAPLFPEKKYDSPSHKFTSYVLPMPNETKGPVSEKTDNIIPQTRPAALNICRSYPMEKNKYEKFGSMSGPTLILDTQSVLKETDSAKASRLPPPLSELKQFDPSIASYAKKPKRQSFSGPITDKQSTDIPSSGSIGYPPHLLRTLLPRPMPTPKLSARASPTFMSSPKISELHELPLPPDNPTLRRPNRNTHSGPLVSTNNELSMPTTTSANPLSPQSLPRSYSIPAGGPVDVDIYVSLQSSKMSDGVPLPHSPPDPLSESQKS